MPDTAVYGTPGTDLWVLTPPTNTWMSETVCAEPQWGHKVPGRGEIGGTGWNRCHRGTSMGVPKQRRGENLLFTGE